MLCEGRLLVMTYGELWDLDPLPSHKPLQNECGLSRASPTLMPGSARYVHQTSTEQTGGADSRSASPEVQKPLLRSLAPRSPQPGKPISLQIEIPAQACSGSDTPFFVPSFCQSICQNYSDLQIGGEQVLPLQASDGELRLRTDAQALDPFLQSCDVPPAVEDSPPCETSYGGHLNPLRRGSNRWSTRDRSIMFHGHEGPFSNSLLNHYLEQKLMDLYQQYMMENIAREGDPHAGPICPLLGSEMVLTSLDQITLQLSREGNLEAGTAKDMVLSCLLRVAGDKQSSEISTPFLQISTEDSREQLTEEK